MSQWILPVVLLLIAATAPAVAADAADPCGDQAVALVVDPDLAAAIRASLDQFRADLCDDGYRSIESSAAYADPPTLRAYLRQLHEQADTQLTGAILVGDLPHAYQWLRVEFANPDIPPLEEEVISFQYYADLDGAFEQSDGYVSPGGHVYSYDIHGGAVDWEIWIASLPYYRDDRSETIRALKRYFEKNHAYRTGILVRPDVFLQVSELLADAEFLETGDYVWSPFAGMPTARLYAGDVSDAWADLAVGAAKFTVHDAHGYWGASGQLSIATVESEPIRTIAYWSNGCAVGNLDYATNFLTSILYSETSEVLVAKGTTNDSGGMGTNRDGFFGANVATALSSGASLGAAVLGHVNVPLVQPWADDRELHYATPVFLGDPTLRFPLDQVMDINAGHSGAWFDPATSGQGQLLDVASATEFLFLAWFTFADAASPQPGFQHWYTAQGPYSGGAAELPIYETVGGAFDNPQPPVTERVGTLSLRFSGCDQGLLDYQFDADGRQGTIYMQRLIPGSGALCEALSSVD